ncbi:MAG: L-threonylcarbamoyladenylate synthase [Nitriliruptoraceae bacterium]
MEQVPPSGHDDGADPPTVVDAIDDREHAITAAADALRAGELVVLPTDTVYGLAADAFHQKGTARIFTAKQRSRSLPLPVLVRSPKQLLGLCTDLPPAAERLMAAYWPGPLTLVVPAQPGMQWDLGRNEGTIGVRMPLDDITLDVIRQLGPLAVTSANTSGSPPARTIAEAISQLGGSVEVYVDGGPREGGAASTVVDLTRSTAMILRSGDLDDNDVTAVAEGALDPLEAAARWTASTAT